MIANLLVQFAYFGKVRLVAPIALVRDIVSPREEINISRVITPCLRISTRKACI